MTKWVAKLSFILTGVGFILAGIYAPEAWPQAVEIGFGLVGTLMAFLGGWLRRPTSSE